MNIMALVIYTANILGIFTDPFEFDGDYGPEVNPIRKTVFELVLHPKESPTLNEIVSKDLLSLLANKQKQMTQFSDDDLLSIMNFIEKYGNKKIFHFIHNNPPQVMKLDKILRDKAAREGKELRLPILSSPELLKGKNAEELKRNFLEYIFTESTLSFLNPVTLNTNATDYQVFTSPAGQTFFFWLYHSLNLHLIGQESDLIEKINFVKKEFATTLGDSQKRAEIFKEKLLQAEAGVLFTQEADSVIPKILTEDNSFYPIDKQNAADGTFVFLRRDLWKEDYKIIPLTEYPDYLDGKVSLVLATLRDTGQKFLLASAHGNSTKAEDGRLQISLIKEKFLQLNKQYPNLQLAIGIDANTKTELEVKLLREHLDRLGLIATNVGPTTIKRRMITAQNAKSGRFAVDEEDYLIILKNGSFELTNQTIGFSLTRPDPSLPLPNLDNQSDHYPVGATLIYVK